MPTSTPSPVQLSFSVWDIIAAMLHGVWLFVQMMPWWFWPILAVAIAVRIVALASRDRPRYRKRRRT